MEKPEITLRSALQEFQILGQRQLQSLEKFGSPEEVELFREALLLGYQLLNLPPHSPSSLKTPTFPTTPLTSPSPTALSSQSFL